MSDSDKLTPRESALLIVLMSQARDISNKELKEAFKIDLSGSSRVKLNQLKYVESWKDGRMFVHRLGEAGWARCRREFNFESPAARAHGAALASLLGAVHRDLVRTDRSLADFFGGLPDAVAAVDLEGRIRAAYRAVASGPGAWVSVADLRVQLADASRTEVDAALRQLERAPDVNIVPESNQKALTDADRLAAIHIGGQDKHFLAIGVG